MRFEEVARLRPIALVRGAVSEAGPFPQVAPSCAVVVATSAPASVTLRSGEVVLEGGVDRRGWIRVSAGGRTSLHRPRRHRRSAGAYDAVALTLTGSQVTVLTRAGGEWTGRARVDLSDRVETRAPAFLAALQVDASAPFEAGPFGQLGLRDLRVVTNADGSPYTRRTGELLLTATSAGPGFFDAAHTSVWALDLDRLDERDVGLTHLSDLFFRREGRVYGDHATHLVRDGDAWLVATSTWGDFSGVSVGVALARTSDDVLTGTHVLDAAPLALPTDGPSVGVWDPHLVHTGEEWLVGYVGATSLKPFRFHPVLASGPSLAELTLRAARPDRRATEGTTIIRLGDQWRVVASDGRDNPRGLRARFPVFDLDLVEVGTLDADYPTNLPWPTLARVSTGSADGERTLMVTFDGSPSGGRLLGYGTHGDVRVLTSPATQSSSGE